MIGFARLFPTLLAIGATIAVSADKQPLDKAACSYKGIPLYGDVQVVDSFPDIKVQTVESFADIHVKKVENFPNDCGKWKFVKNFPDVKIQYVDSFPDIKIKMVTSFPGMQ
ncbi:MAG: hypothetical protein V3V15_06710 [Sphingorhabdus sp.]